MPRRKEIPAFAGYLVCCNLCSTFEDSRGISLSASMRCQNWHILVRSAPEVWCYFSILQHSIPDNALINPILFLIQQILSPLPGKSRASSVLLRETSTYDVVPVRLPVFLWSSTLPSWGRKIKCKESTYLPAEPWERWVRKHRSKVVCTLNPSSFLQ